MINANLQSVIS